MIDSGTCPCEQQRLIISENASENAYFAVQAYNIYAERKYLSTGFRSIGEP